MKPGEQFSLTVNIEGPKFVDKTFFSNQNRSFAVPKNSKRLTFNIVKRFFFAKKGSSLAKKSSRKKLHSSDNSKGEVVGLFPEN